MLKINKKTKIVIAVFVAILFLIGAIFLIFSKKEITPDFEQDKKDISEDVSEDSSEEIFTARKGPFSARVDFVGISSDGSHVYYQKQEDLAFYKHDLSSNYEEKISDPIDMIYDVVWAPDFKKAIFVVKQDSYFFEKYNSPFNDMSLKDGETGYWIFDFELQKLTRMSPMISDPKWSPDGSRVLYAYVNEEKKDKNISIIDQKTLDHFIIKSVDYYSDLDLGFLNNGEIYYYSKGAGLEGSVLKKVDINTKEERILSEGVLADLFFVSYSGDGAFYDFYAKESPEYRVGYLDLKTLESKDLGVKDYVVEDLLFVAGQGFAVAKIIDDQGGESLAKISLSDGSKISITGARKAGEIGRFYYNPKDKSVYYLDLGYLRSVKI